jgi:hypothetical protein
MVSYSGPVDASLAGLVAFDKPCLVKNRGDAAKHRRIRKVSQCSIGRAAA